jgi:hypothetical protein
MLNFRDYFSKKWIALKTKSKSIWRGIPAFWRRYKFQTILALLIAIAIFVFWRYINKDKFSFDDELQSENKALYIRNIALLLAAIATAVFTWWKNNINQKVTEIQESTRQDSLFAQAADFLKENNDLATRKAGVYILKDLAMSSPNHAQKCIDMLCSLNESWMPKFLKDYPFFFIINRDFPNIKNIEEIELKETCDETDLIEILYFTDDKNCYKNQMALSQLVLLTVSEIIRYISQNIEYRGPYNLSYKFLCSGNSEGIDFRKFDNLEGVNFQSANLSEANFQLADLGEANFQSAYLSEADFQSAFLCGAHFESSYLNKANFESTYLMHAHFELADLSGTHFESAELAFTDFRNAENIDTAIFNDNKKDSIFNNKDYNRLNKKKK